MTKLARNSYTFREGLAMMAAKALGIDPDLAVDAGDSATAVINLIRHAVKLKGPGRDAALRDAERELRRISPRRHPELVEALHNKLMDVAGHGRASINPATGAEEFFWPFDQLKDAASRVGRGIGNALGIGSARAKQPDDNDIEPITVTATRRGETLLNPSRFDLSNKFRIPDITGSIAQRGLEAATSNTGLGEPKRYPTPGVERVEVRGRDTSRKPINGPEPPRDIPNYVFRKGSEPRTIPYEKVPPGYPSNGEIYEIKPIHIRGQRVPGIVSAEVYENTPENTSYLQSQMDRFNEATKKEDYETMSRIYRETRDRVIPSGLGVKLDRDPLTAQEHEDFSLAQNMKPNSYKFAEPVASSVVQDAWKNYRKLDPLNHFVGSDQKVYWRRLDLEREGETPVSLLRSWDETLVGAGIRDDLKRGARRSAVRRAYQNLPSADPLPDYHPNAGVRWD